MGTRTRLQQWLPAAAIIVATTTMIGLPPMMNRSEGGARAVPRAERPAQMARPAPDPGAGRDGDVKALLLRDSARRHLAAVRGGLDRRPDDALMADLDAYAAGGGRNYAVAALRRLRSSAAALQPLGGPPVRCATTTVVDGRCADYFTAMAAAFGGTL